MLIARVILLDSTFEVWRMYYFFYKRRRIYKIAINEPRCLPTTCSVVQSICSIIGASSPHGTHIRDNKRNWFTKVPASHTVYPKKYAHGFCIAVLCCGYTLTDFPISIRLTSLALWQPNDCPSASKATLMNMDKYFMWIHYERLLTTTKQSTTKPCAHFLGYTVLSSNQWALWYRLLPIEYYHCPHNEKHGRYWAVNAPHI